MPNCSRRGAKQTLRRTVVYKQIHTVGYEQNSPSPRTCKEHRQTFCGAQGYAPGSIRILLGRLFDLESQPRAARV